jgi:hypothetical protein
MLYQELKDWLLEKAGIWQIDIVTGEITGPYFYVPRSDRESNINSRIKNQYQLYVVLHELGHKTLVYDDDRKDNYKIITVKTVFDEIMAWRYARGCVKKEYYEHFDALAVTCIMTYSDDTKAKNVFDEERIRFLLTWNL